MATCFLVDRVTLIVCLCLCLEANSFPIRPPDGIHANENVEPASEKVVEKLEIHDHSQHVGDMKNSGHTMTFHFGDKVTLLFDFWSVKSRLGLALSCLAVAAIAAAIELLKVVKLDLVIKYYRTRYPASSNKPSMKKWELFAKNFVISSIVAIQATLSFFIMLITMSFNVWLFASAIIGLFLGQCIVAFKLYLPNHYYDDETCH